MSNYFYHPLGDNYADAPPFSYLNHGNGKLDFSIGEVPFYAIADGEIVFCGSYADGNVAIIQECKDSNLGITFYIRYLHGINNGELLNTYVKKGTQLGTVSNNAGRYGNHLHIDFSLVFNNFQPVIGKLTPASGSTSATWSYGAKTYKISPKIDLSQVREWAAQNDGVYDGPSYQNPGYCWLVFAQNPEYLTRASSGSYDGSIDVSSLFTSESDWNALYGMIAYEENVLFSDFETNDVYKAILEWVIRVFRNRLFSGISIDSICLWNSGQPGRADAESRASQVPQNIRNFAKDIISGKDYFYVERYAEQYFYGDWPDKDKWYNRLYSADTFYGGYSARWPSSTLAQVPFEYGPYFYFEGEFTNEVFNKFWPNGRDGEAAYPNPYPVDQRRLH